MTKSDHLTVEGFEEYHTGGGCMALAMKIDENRQVLITDEGGMDFPRQEDVDNGIVLVGCYDWATGVDRCYHLENKEAAIKAVNELFVKANEGNDPVAQGMINAMMGVYSIAANEL